MGKINVLSFAVANLIAAGEVVDRPASAVKELLENAIDAGATRITVEIQNGGVTFLRVADNGCGIDVDDLPVAVRRHATSKIKTAEDLEGIETLGFRGEALAAIASVSDMRIISKTADAETTRSRKKRKLSEQERAAEITKLEKEMREAAKMLEFEYAAVLRDRIIELKGET